MQIIENNKITRRQGILAADSYESISNDIASAFGGFEGVSTEITEDYTKIFFNNDCTHYLMIAKNTNPLFRITLNCGSPTKEGYNFVYVDGNSRGQYIAYSIAKTPYGVAFTTFPNINANENSTASASDSLLQNFFSTFTDSEGNSVNCFVYVSQPANNDSATAYILSDIHDYIETIPMSKYFLGNNANQTVLMNATSFVKNLASDHLFKTLQAEDSMFGKIVVGGRRFIAGSHFALECGEADENNQ